VSYFFFVGSVYLTKKKKKYKISSQALNPSAPMRNAPECGDPSKKEVDGEPQFTEKLYFVRRKVNCLGEEDQKTYNQIT
jgi:hypothetical protein